MKVLEILGENRFSVYSRIREACRGIVLREGKLLLSYEVNSDQWFVPGGGMEGGESPEECCIRELAEETGFAVKPLRRYLTIHEYYEEWLFISHYFICEVTGETGRALTEREAQMGLEPRWLPWEEALEIFSKHESYAVSDEMKRGAYLREYTALQCLENKK